MLPSRSIIGVMSANDWYSIPRTARRRVPRSPSTECFLQFLLGLNCGVIIDNRVSSMVTPAVVEEWLEHVVLVAIVVAAEH